MDFLKQALRTDSSDYPTFILRLAAGLFIFPYGAQKLLGWFGGNGFEGTMGFFTGQLGIPYAIALLVIIGEFFGGLGLITGLLTRLSGLGLFMIMLGATFMVQWSNGFFGGVAFHLLAAMVGLFLLLKGGGALALDSLILQQLQQQTGGPQANPDIA